MARRLLPFVAAAAALAPAAAGADPGELSRVQCLAASTAGCDRALAVARPSGVVAFGATVYVRSGVGSLGTLGVFARDARTGRLAQLQCVARRTRRCSDGRGLETPAAVAISPDGRSAYVAAQHGRAVGVYARARSGRLTARGSVTAVPGARALAVSPDGGSVYVGGDRLWTFRRAASGALSLAGTIATPTGAIAVSPDGSTVYAAGGGGRHGTLTSYVREPGNGALTTSVTVSAPATPGLRQPAQLRATRDGVYVVATVSGAVTRFDSSLRPEATARALPAATGLAVTPDRVFVAYRDGVAVLTRGLVRRGRVTLRRALGVAAAGRSVYAVSPGRVTVFRRVR